MISLLLQAGVICSVSWLLWKYFRQLVVSSPLDNIPGPPNKSWIYGNLPQLLDRVEGWNFMTHLTDSYPSGIAKLHGPLGHRMLYVFDPTALHTIIVKEQHVFEEASFFIRSNRLFFGPGLLGTLGETHRKQRKLLNPAFSIAHMRRMIPIFNVVGHQLVKGIENCVRANPNGEVDVLSWMGRTALELIGQAGLGYSFDPLVADTPDAFGTAIKAFQPTVTNINLLRRLLPYTEIGSPAFQRKMLELLPNASVQRMKDIVDTIWDRSKEIYESKKSGLEKGDDTVAQQIGEGNDLMSILLKANMNASEQDKLPDDELLGQMATFIFAAMDTTSNALAMTIYLLAEHPDVQEKLRAEILEASKGENLGHDTLVALPYLDAVCRETLRLHAPVAQVFRETRADAVLQLSTPIRGVDGKMMTEIPVPKDTTVSVALLSSNRNKAIWGEDAGQWKPERWLKPLPNTIQEAKIPGVYSNLMTFLGGSRGCIGFKFSQLEMKVVLCLLLSKFTFAPSGKDIFWNNSGVRFPSVGKTGSKASLPMKISLYKPVA